MGLREAQASVGATLAYWLGNTLLNPAVIVFMGFALGWHWVALRVAVGVLLVFGVAYAANWIAVPEAPGLPAPVAPGPRPAPADGDLWRRWWQAFWRLAIRIVPEYAVLVLLLGAARAWLFPAATVTAGNSAAWTIGLAVAGTLFVIPTAGEIPIVQTLMSFGLGTAPAAALLMTLPPVSLPSLVMVGKALPVRVVLFVAAAVAALGMLSGAAAVALRF